MGEYEALINEHYGRNDVGERILSGLRAAGRDIDALTREDLDAWDQLHVGGARATCDVATLAKLEPGERVLDVGCGLGGPARALAAEFGCVVTGVDLTKEFCRAAEMLTARLGLSDSVAFRVGDARKIPVEDGAFDVAWMQHVSMNVDDKGSLLAEVRRALRPGGRFVFYELCGVPGAAALHFPVPWASDPSLSFVVSTDALRDVLKTEGFTEIAWRDVTAGAMEWFEAIEREAASRPSDAPPAGLHAIVGDDFPRRAANVRRNMDEQRLVAVMAVYRRGD